MASRKRWVLLPHTPPQRSRSPAICIPAQGTFMGLDYGSWIFRSWRGRSQCVHLPSERQPSQCDISKRTFMWVTKEHLGTRALDGMLITCDCLTATSLHYGGWRRDSGRMPRHFIIGFQSTWKWVPHGPEECAGVTECEAARQPPVSRGCSRTVTLGPRTLPTAILWKLNLWKHINSFQVTIKRNETDKASSCFRVCQATRLRPN